MSRKYFNCLAPELQEIFESNKDNPTVLKELLAELKHRNSQAALRLNEDIKYFLERQDNIQEDRPTSTSNSTNIQEKPGSYPEIKSTSKSRSNPEQDKGGNSSTLLAKNISNSIIENIGCQNKPEKLIFKDKETVNLVHNSENSSLSKVYEEALRALISELKRTKKGENKFLLEKGYRVILDGRSTGYKFAFNEDAQIFEGAQVSINCNSNGCSGRIVSISNNELIVETDDDFGEMVRGCTISLYLRR